MKKIIFCNIYIVALLSLLSCNKESIFENIAPDPKIIVVNKTYPLTYTNNETFIIKIESFDVQMRIQTLVGKGYINVSPFTSTDSISMTSIYPSGIGVNTLDNCVKKLNKNEDVSETFFYNNTAPHYLQFSKKSAPYSNSYTSVNTSFLYSGKIIKPTFGLNQTGYVGCEFFTTTGFKFFGWLYLTFSQSSFTIEKLAYCSSIIKAGIEK